MPETIRAPSGTKLAACASWSELSISGVAETASENPPLRQPLAAPLARTKRLTGFQIVATGSYTPDILVSNEDLQTRHSFDPRWIEERTGIRQRRHAPADWATSDLCREATLRCLRAAGVAKEDVDLLVVATHTPDLAMPGTACLVQEKLGLFCGAFDVQAACAGFMVGLSVGAQFVKTGNAQRCLVVGADVSSRIVNPADQGIYPLFGDGAGAVLLAPGEAEQGFLAYQLGTDGSGAELLGRPAGGSRTPLTAEALQTNQHFLRMNGRAVFRWAVETVCRSVGELLYATGLSANDIQLFVPHQANQRILQSVAQRLGLPDERVFSNIERYGNTMAGSIPLALDEAAAAGRIRRGDRILAERLRRRLELGQRPRAMVRSGQVFAIGMVPGNSLGAKENPSIFMLTAAPDSPTVRGYFLLANGRHDRQRKPRGFFVPRGFFSPHLAMGHWSWALCWTTSSRTARSGLIVSRLSTVAHRRTGRQVATLVGASLCRRWTMRENTPPAPLRVLVVDDWPDTVESMATLLRLWGHDVRIAHDGPAALALADSYRPDVVLLDMGLPGMDGLEVARRMRDNPRLTGILLVCLSGYGRENDAQLAREAGCDLHLLKPVEPNVLQRLLASRQNAQTEGKTVSGRMEPVEESAPVDPQDLSEAAENRLRGNPYLALKNISCECRAGVLTLRGCLPSYYLKQIAQSAVAHLKGVHGINNEIEVVGQHSVATVAASAAVAPGSSWDRSFAEDFPLEPAQTGLRVLVVEDDPETAQIMAMMFRRRGHEIRIAPDGLAGLEAARDNWPDVVLLDIDLPGMDGWEVARRLDRPAKEKRPLLIAVTGYGEDEDRRRSAEAGIDLHLVKPVDGHHLQGLLKRFHTIIC